MNLTKFSGHRHFVSVLLTSGVFLLSTGCASAITGQVHADDSFLHNETRQESDSADSPDIRELPESRIEKHTAAVTHPSSGQLLDSREIQDFYLNWSGEYIASDPSLPGLVLSGEGILDYKDGPEGSLQAFHHISQDIVEAVFVSSSGESSPYMLRFYGKNCDWNSLRSRLPEAFLKEEEAGIPVIEDISRGIFYRTGA